MQGHIVVIGTDRDDNWDVAKEHRLWASSRGQHVTAGDLLFFWQAGGPGLRHVARATTDGERVAADEVLPWEDDVVYDYKWKFGLEVLVDSADVDATWSDVQDALGNRSRPNHAVLQLPNSAAVERLRRLFPGMDDPAPPADAARSWTGPTATTNAISSCGPSLSAAGSGPSVRHCCRLTAVPAR